MHILMYFAVVLPALIALLFVTDATLEKGAQPIVTTQRVGLPIYSSPQSDANPHLDASTCARHDVAARAGCRTEGPSGA